VAVFGVLCFAIIAPLAALVAALSVAWTGAFGPDVGFAGAVAFAVAFFTAETGAVFADAVTVAAFVDAAFVALLGAFVAAAVAFAGAVFLPGTALAVTVCAGAFLAAVFLAGTAVDAFVTGSFVAFAAFFADRTPGASRERSADRTPGASRERSAAPPLPRAAGAAVRAPAFAAPAVAFAVALRPAVSAMGYPHMQNGRAAGAAHSE
jgi:hypothetical protein